MTRSKAVSNFPLLLEDNQNKNSKNVSRKSSHKLQSENYMSSDDQDIVENTFNPTDLQAQLKPTFEFSLNKIEEKSQEDSYQTLKTE